MQLIFRLHASLAILFAGSLVFTSQVLFQQILAVSFGTGSSLTAIVILITLFSGALGAQIRKIPIWIAPTILGGLLLSIIPTEAIHETGIWIAIGFMFFSGLLCGFWISSLLNSVTSSKTISLVGMEWLGGALGTAIFLLYMMPHFSITQNARILGALSLLGAIFSWKIAPANQVHESFAKARFSLLALGLSAWSGFQFFFSEISWSNLLAQVHTNSYMAFGIVLLSTLIAMPVAAIVVSKIYNPRIIAILAILGNLSLPILSHLLAPHLALHHAQQAFPWAMLLFTIAILAPVTIGSSLLFPYLLKDTKHQQSPQNLYSANLLGGLLGACAAGYVSLPHLGLDTSLCIPIIGWGILLIAWSKESAHKFIMPISIAGAASAIALCVVLWHGNENSAQTYRVVARAEDWGGRMELVERAGDLYLLHNGSYALGGSHALVPERKQAELALSLRPNAHSAFVLGLGTGITADRVAQSNAMQRIRIVELNPSVIELAHKGFQTWTQQLFSSPIAQIEAGDARVALLHDTTSYDIILGDLFLPWLPGAELLMSTEHFQSVQQHLTPTGIFVQWLPLFQISEPLYQDVLASILAVFPNVYLFRGDLDSDQPMVALVAPKPGASLYAQGASPEVLKNYTGNACRLRALLQNAKPWTADNRIERIMQSGGLFSGMPRRDQAMTGERYLNWIARAFLSMPPEHEPAIQEFGAEAWRYAAQGFFIQQALYYEKMGDANLANLAAQRSIEFGPK